MKARNVVAHESASSFAQLLLSDDFKDSDAYHQWVDAFQIVYNATIEELASQQEDTDNDLFGNLK